MESKEKVEARRVSIYLHNDQFEYLDKECEKAGVSRSKYIEMKIFPESLQKLLSKKGAPKKK